MIYWAYKMKEKCILNPGQVTLIAAQTVDGFIGRTNRESSFDWTSPEDKQFYISVIKQADVIIMGRATFGTFSRYPRGAHFVIMTREPEAFSNPRPAVITAEASDEVPARLIERLRQAGKQKIVIAGGSSIYGQFLAAGVVDRLLLTIEPLLFGQGVKLVDQSLELGLRTQQYFDLSADTRVGDFLVI